MSRESKSEPDWAEVENVVPWRDNLKAELRIRGIDYKEASIRLGWNDAYVSKMLKGTFCPSINRLLSLCLSNGIDPALVIKTKTSSRKLEKFFEAARELTEEEALEALASLKKIS